MDVWGRQWRALSDFCWQRRALSLPWRVGGGGVRHKGEGGWERVRTMGERKANEGRI